MKLGPPVKLDSRAPPERSLDPPSNFGTASHDLETAAPSRGDVPRNPGGHRPDRARRSRPPVVARPARARALRRRHLRDRRTLEPFAARLPAIDPTVIAYAPPGLPVLIGLAYLVFGVKDMAAILVSITAGTLTIPVAAWLARRTFGPGAGGVAAAFAALSGPHIAFSRMALTDASFLLFWLVAIGMGQRFLERPQPFRAVAMGLAVGLAQLFKYNGWIAGAIVVASAAAWLVCHPTEWRTKTTAATWGWGLSARSWPPRSTGPGIGSSTTTAATGAPGAPAQLSGRPIIVAGSLVAPARRRAISLGNPGWLISAGLAAAIAMLVSTGDFASDRRRSGGSSSRPQV